MLLWLSVGVTLVLIFATPMAGAADLGMFEDHGDIGAATAAGGGSAAYDAQTQTYTVTGAGKNLWLAEDAFHFVWKKVPAGSDLTLAASIDFAAAAAGADPHRKAVVMIRQSLDADSAYADACLHGNGLTAIQFRPAKGALTYETQAQANAPRHVRLEKRGPVISMSFGASATDPQPAGGACRVELTGDFYVGIGVCPHDITRVETARFTDVKMTPIDAIAAGKTRMRSTLETIQLASNDRRAVCVVTQPGLQRAEAPNWSANGTLYFNSGGKLYTVPADLPGATPPAAAAATPRLIDLGPLTNINNDHVLSPDGKHIAVSDQSQDDRRSTIWVSPIEGATAGPARRVTPNTPSYLHGWSPDGKTLAYCGERDRQFDIYTIPVEGGPETRLTTADGKDDGPEYSPDGQSIYFNSDRTGTMQIWRMKADGTEQEQLTRDARNNWFPHVSPDGRQMAYIAYEAGVTDHPENKDVELRVMDLQTHVIKTVAYVFGGQGTMNVNSWSPDGKHLAFVSYQIVPE